MPRSKSTSAIRHRKILKAVKGFKQARRTRIKAAKEALLHAGHYAYVGRKLKKRDLRSLWITRIGIATKNQELSYSKFIAGLKTAKIDLDRKILSELAARDIDTFNKIVDKVKESFKS